MTGMPHNCRKQVESAIISRDKLNEPVDGENLPRILLLGIALRFLGRTWCHFRCIEASERYPISDIVEVQLTLQSLFQCQAK